MNSPFLLQIQMVFKEDDPQGAIILLISVAAIILIGILVNVLKRGTVSSMKVGGRRDTADRGFSVFQIRKVANLYGFDKDQTRLLEQVFKANGVTNPQSVLQNTLVLDKHFRRAYRNIERRGNNEEEVQNNLSTLFSIRNSIEANSQSSGSQVNSTRRIPENTSGVISTGKDASYPTKAFSSKGDYLLVESPVNAVGSPVRFQKGTRVNVTFFTKSNQGYSFSTQVVGTTDTQKGYALQLAHSSHANSMAKRRSKRKEVKLNCEYSIIHLQEFGYGRKKERKMVVDPRRYKANILDLSAGGCAIKTSSDINIGAQIKLNFQNLDGNNLAALGQVIRINQSRGMGIILHIKFLKTTRRSLNAINAMVYDYDQD